jgi:predicted acetyltransferase
MLMSLEICQHNDEHKSVIWNVFQFYCYDTSVEEGYDLKEDGRYSLCAEYFSQYWTHPRWRAHLLRWNGAIAGFALLEASEALDDAQEIADLFVMKRFRRHGIARKVVQHFMGQRVEPWTVVVFDDATEAQLFWQSIFQDPQFKPDRQVADPDDRAVTVYVLEPNVQNAPVMVATSVV